MHWEESVRKALCYGWIDCTVKVWELECGYNTSALENQKVCGVK